jgi:hypothetical protein
MSGFNPLLSPHPPAIEEAEEERERFEQPLTGYENGPQPWCRLCQKGVDDWIWARLPDRHWHIAAKCHGTTCAGFIPETLTPRTLRVEMFCYNDPHLEGRPLWFVQWDGSEAQPTKIYLTNAVKRGGKIQGIRKVAIYVWPAMTILFFLWQMWWVATPFWRSLN